MDRYSEKLKILKEIIPFAATLSYEHIGSSKILKDDSEYKVEIDIKVTTEDFFTLFYLIENLEKLGFKYLDEYKIRECWVFESNLEYKVFLCRKNGYFDLVQKDLQKCLIRSKKYFSEYERIVKHVKDNKNYKNNLFNQITIEKLKIKQNSVILPNYKNTLLNVVSSISSYYGKNNPYPKNERVSELIETNEYNHIILMILDGLGSIVMDKNKNETTYLHKNKIEDITSLFPSTTAAATTSIISGLAPLESGWTGWENYVSEINRNVILFTGENYFTGETTGVDIKKTYLPYKEFYDGFSIPTKTQMPAFVEGGASSFAELLKNTGNFINKNSKSFQYVYWSEPDFTMHMNGVDSSKSKEVIKDLDSKVKKFADDLGDDVLLIVSADHGHINVSDYPFWFNSELSDMLSREPSNDSRCLTFKVRDEYMDIFPKIFDKYYHGLYKIYPKNYVIGNGFLGNVDISPKNPRIDDFMADYVAIAISDIYIKYSKNSISMKSHHAGMTEDEMLVPLIIIEKRGN